MPTFKIKDLLVSVGTGWCGPTTNATHNPCLISCLFSGGGDNIGDACTPGCTGGGDSCNGSGGPCKAGCSAVVTAADGITAALAECTPGCTAGGDSCNGSGGPCRAGCSAIVTNAGAQTGCPIGEVELAALKTELRNVFAQLAEREADLRAAQAARPVSAVEIDAMERHLSEALEELRHRKAKLGDGRA